MGAFEKYYNLSLRFLSYRPRCEKEVRDNLRKKKADPTVIDKIINKLKEQNFINDKEFVAWWIEQRTIVRPKSMRVVMLELKQKGIDQELIELVMQQKDFVVPSDTEQAKKLIEKKIVRYKTLPKQQLYQKLGGFLARKGFDWETIKKSIDEELTKEV